jgi:hypothetical protein
MKLRRRIAIHRPRSIMLENRCNPFARGLRNVVTAHPGLHMLFRCVERNLESLAMRFTNAFVAPNQRGLRNGFRR